MTTGDRGYIAKITAGGQEFPIPFDDHSWDIVPGYVTQVQAWVVPADVADKVMSAIEAVTGADREVTLTFGEPSLPIVVSRVVVLGSAPADNVQRRHLLFADVRWYFTRAVMCIDANVRRRMGDTRYIGDTPTDMVIVDNIAYAPWSINNSAAYTWTTFKNQVVAYLSAGGHGRPSVTFVTDTFSVVLQDQAIQEVTTDGEAYVGLARAIESIPAAGLYVALDGKLHVYDRVPGAERSVIDQLPPPLWQHGDLVWVNNSSIRPNSNANAASWRVYVDYEVEARLTYNVSGSGLWSTVSSKDPYLIPVLQVTDLSLDVPAGSWGAARTVGQGTWLPQDQAFAAYGSVTVWKGAHTFPQLTDDIVARHWFGDGLNHYAMGGVLPYAGGGLGGTDYDPAWGRRISEVLRCFRTFFQVNPGFWDLIRHAWSVRAAIIDPTTGTRAPSPVYSNFSKWPLDQFAPADVNVWGANVNGSYPDSGLLADGAPSGFIAHIEDVELGIISISRDIRRFAGQARIAPSPVEKLADITQSDVDLMEACTQHLVSATTKPTDTQLSQWKLATIVSCAPGAPNDRRRLYEIQVSTADAASTAGLSSAPTGHGPDQEVRSYLSQARIAWTDDSDRVDAILSLLGAKDAAPDIGVDDPILTLTPINLTQELKPLAKAVAAADLLSKLDRYEGSRTVPQCSALVPLGSINRVSHRILENRAVTVVHCSPTAPPFHAIDFLHGSARSYLLKQVAVSR